jgi:hypothetical protein
LEVQQAQIPEGILWQYFLKVKLHEAVDLEVSGLGIYLREMNVYDHQKVCARIFSAASVIVAPNEK